MYSSVSCTARSSASQIWISCSRDSFICELSMAAKTGDAAASTARCAGKRAWPQTTSTSEKRRSPHSCDVMRCACSWLCAGEVGGSLMTNCTACTTRWLSSPWLPTKVSLHWWLRRDMLSTWDCHSEVLWASQLANFCHASPARTSSESRATPMPSPRSFQSTRASTCWPCSASKTKAWSRTWPGSDAQYCAEETSIRCEASWFM
mmetsp:Transcript_76330/g.196550  ORF Transcript_76330/g.196550 Transcript_76330/m.196550 type:complete len:205 (+) Transcript_76330:221-835(+)